MKRRSTLALCTAALVAGMVIGAGAVSWQFSTPVRANALDLTTADRIYQDLAGDSPLQQGSHLLAKIASVTTPSVVHIQSQRRSSGRGIVEETGSGILMSSPKSPGIFVITNRHVIDGADNQDISIHIYDGQVLRPEKVWSDKATDVAVIKVGGRNLVPARWGDSNAVEIGHMVLAMGSPFGLSRSVTLGIISAKGRRSLKLGSGAEVLNQDFLQTDAAINPGNSGGPLIDLQGHVVGINTAIASSSGGNEGIGFSIPSNLVRRIMDQLLEHNIVRRAYLGVKLDPSFESATASRLRMDRVRGARIAEVYPNTPASRANLQFDDVILTFDGADVQDENHLINLVSLTPVGKQVRLSVWRDGKAIKITVTLSDRTEHQTSEAPTKPDMGVPVRPMGLRVHQLDADLATQLGYDRTTRGLLVLKIEPGSPLAKEVSLYDIIEEVGRTPVASIDDLTTALEQTPPGSPLLVRLRRTTEGRTDSHLVVWRN